MVSYEFSDGQVKLSHCINEDDNRKKEDFRGYQNNPVQVFKFSFP